MQRHIKDIVARVHRSGRARGDVALPWMHDPHRGAQAGAGGTVGTTEGMDTTAGVDEGALSAEEAAPAAEYHPQPKAVRPEPDPEEAAEEEILEESSQDFASSSR